MDKDKIKEIFGDEVSYTDNFPEDDINFNEDNYIKERIITDFLRLMSKERIAMLHTLIKYTYTK